MHKKNASDWRKHLDFIIIDMFCMHLAFLLAYFLRHKNWDMYQNWDYRQVILVMIGIDILVAILFSSFKNVLIAS